MSIVFKPVIPPALKPAKSKFVPKGEGKKIGRPSIPFTKLQLIQFIELRAKGISHIRCGELLGNSHSFCNKMAGKEDIALRIAIRRNELVKEVMEMEEE
jgi:hypothetical protein